MKPKAAHKFMQVIESLTHTDNVRKLVDEIYPDRPPEDKARISQTLTEEFTEMLGVAKGGKKDGRDVSYFLDDPPTAVFVTAYQKQGLTSADLGDCVSPCDDGRLWINATAMAADASRYKPGKERD